MVAHHVAPHDYWLFGIGRLIGAGIRAGRRGGRLLTRVDVVHGAHHREVVGRRPDHGGQVAGARVRRRQEAARRTVAVEVGRRAQRRESGRRGHLLVRPAHHQLHRLQHVPLASARNAGN